MIKGKQIVDSTIIQEKLNLTTPVLDFDAATKEYVDLNQSIEKFSTLNLEMTAENTGVSGEAVLVNIALAEQPTKGVNVYVNGILENTSTYFKDPTGTVQRAFGEEQQGDICYLSASSNFRATTTDIVDFIYLVSSIGGSSSSGGTGGDYWNISGLTILNNNADVIIDKPAVTGLDINSIIIRGAGDRTAAAKGYYTSELVLSNDGDNYGGNFAKLGSYQTVDGDTESYIEMDSGEEMRLYSRNGTDYTSVRVSRNVFSITGGWGGIYSTTTFSQTGITLHSPAGTNNSILIRDDSLRGMHYYADYSALGALYGDRWIPDYGAVKAYADSVGGGTPAGNNTEIQFNNNGVFGADANLSYDGTLNVGNLSLASQTIQMTTTLFGNSVKISTESDNWGELTLRKSGANNIFISASNPSYINAGRVLGIGTSTPNNDVLLDLVDTSAITLPKGTTLERPTTGVSSMLRFNSDLTTFEGYDGTAWLDLAASGGGTPAGTDSQIQFNNAGSFGASNIFTWDGTSLGIGTSTPRANSVIDMTSTTKGFYPPRVTNINKNALTLDFNDVGLTLFVTSPTNRGLNIWNGLRWEHTGDGNEGHHTLESTSQTTNASSSFSPDLPGTNVAMSAKITWVGYTAANNSTSSGEFVSNFSWNGTAFTEIGTPTELYNINNSGDTLTVTFVVDNPTSNLVVGIISAAGIVPTINVNWITTRSA